MERFVFLIFFMHCMVCNV